MTDKELLSRVESELSALHYPRRARELYVPIAYTLDPGGKRLRPLLCLRGCEAVGADPMKAINQAVGIEMFHNFTLIHDDVMDGSDTRRGHPTVYAEWGSTQAILSGDALLTMATRKVVEGIGCENVSSVLELFNRTALEVYEGQQLDIEFESRDDVTTDEYIEMIRLKTSVLLGCACAMGCIVAGADSSTVSALYRYGEQLGLAFQLRDDWLDTFGDSGEFGKAIGTDIRNRKKTWLFITACNEAPAEMARALECGDDDVVERVTKVYDSLGLSERCDAMARRFCDEALNEIGKAEISGESRRWFVETAERLCKRNK